MPWPIRLVESREAAQKEFGFVPVGAMWPVKAEHLALWMETWFDGVAPRYVREHQHLRPPMFVKLPDGTDFCIDTRAYQHPQGHYGDGWGCAGDPPNITLSPSINCVGRYHGFIRDGVITDDCEGRQFPNARGFPK